ncbi:MAG TPA: VOC family protein [Tepidisphaeraceae bacterium]|nr:VOC family protein [Tepidisphaeraceae bacterium]
MSFGAERLEHVTIVVTDVDRARTFYGGILELTEVPRPKSFDFPGTWYQMGPTFLHLLGKPQADGTSARHFCLWVRDVQSAARHAQDAGCEVKWEAKHKIPGIDRFFLYDPDGNRVEIQGDDVPAAGQ